MAAYQARVLQTNQPGFADTLRRLCSGRSEQGSAQLSADVRAIIERVKTEGDVALLDYANTFDGIQAAAVKDLVRTPDDFRAALEGLDSKVRQALVLAADRIRQYHEHQRQASWQYEDEYHNLLGQRISALARVCFYVPGGQACYPSSVLMSMIPAQVAGVAERIMVSPISGGHAADAVLAAASLAGAHKCYTCGGAHAIAAFAYGTESVPRVDKIVGPGGLYVTEAKRQVFGQVGIDMIAGPSEVLIVSDGSASPVALAWDMLAQAEHDVAAQALIMSPNRAHLDAVARAITEQLRLMPRQEICQRSLTERGALIQCRDLTEAIELANRIAPEHLALAVRDPDAVLPAIRHAGAVFLGGDTPEAIGDYTAGPSHVLPTSGAARFSSPLGVYDFIKRSSVMRINKQTAAILAQSAVTLARAEGFEAHARSVEARFADLDGEH